MAEERLFAARGETGAVDPAVLGRFWSWAETATEQFLSLYPPEEREKRAADLRRLMESHPASFAGIAPESIVISVFFGDTSLPERRLRRVDASLARACADMARFRQTGASDEATADLARAATPGGIVDEVFIAEMKEIAVRERTRREGERRREALAAERRADAALAEHEAIRRGVEEIETSWAVGDVFLEELRAAAPGFNLPPDAFRGDLDRYLIGIMNVTIGPHETGPIRDTDGFRSAVIFAEIYLTTLRRRLEADSSSCAASASAMTEVLAIYAEAVQRYDRAAGSTRLAMRREFPVVRDLATGHAARLDRVARLFERIETMIAAAGTRVEAARARLPGARRTRATSAPPVPAGSSIMFRRPASGYFRPGEAGR